MQGILSGQESWFSHIGHRDCNKLPSRKKSSLDDDSNKATVLNTPLIFHFILGKCLQFLNFGVLKEYKVCLVQIPSSVDVPEHAKKN